MFHKFRLSLLRRVGWRAQSYYGASSASSSHKVEVPLCLIAVLCSWPCLGHASLFQTWSTFLWATLWDGPVKWENCGFGCSPNGYNCGVNRKLWAPGQLNVMGGSREPRQSATVRLAHQWGLVEEHSHSLWSNFTHRAWSYTPKGFDHMAYTLPR